MDKRKNSGIKCLKLKEEKVFVMYTVSIFHFPLLKLFFAKAV